MKMIKRLVFSFLAVTTVAIAAGCGPLGLSGTASTAANPAVTSAGQPSGPQATPYSQPLMAAGGDLVMLCLKARGIAG
ncbi:MAG TPA: hypothetical protein VGH29_00240 [Candidatus Binataceae bacterium]|jgi:hypothetical protein